MGPVSTQPEPQYHALIVDADTESAGVLGRFLRLRNTSAEVVPDAEQALPRVHQACHDVVVLSLALPAPGLLNLVLRARTASCNRVAVVVLCSPWSRPQDDTAILTHLNPDAVFRKPFVPQEVAQGIADAAARRRDGSLPASWGADGVAVPAANLRRPAVPAPPEPPRSSSARMKAVPSSRLASSGRMRAVAAQDGGAAPELRRPSSGALSPVLGTLLGAPAGLFRPDAESTDGGDRLRGALPVSRQASSGRMLAVPSPGLPQLRASLGSAPARTPTAPQPAVPAGTDAVKSIFRDVLCNVLQTSPLRKQVDIHQVLVAMLANWDKMARPGALDVTPLFRFIIDLPAVDLMDATRAFLFLKLQEARVGVAIRLPVMISSIPEDQKADLLREVSTSGVHSGLTP